MNAQTDLDLLTVKMRCAQCGKRFEHSAAIEHWPYANKKPVKNFCSYKCMMQYRAKTEEIKHIQRNRWKNVKVTDAIRRQIFDDFVNGKSVIAIAKDYDIGIDYVQVVLETERFNRRAEHDKSEL